MVNRSVAGIAGLGYRGIQSDSVPSAPNTADAEEDG